jgi:hypothetical protein
MRDALVFTYVTAAGGCMEPKFVGAIVGYLSIENK